MNRVAAVAGDEVRQKVLSRQWKLFRGEIIRLAKFDDEALKLKIEEVAAAGGRLPPGDRPEPNALPSNPRAQVLALAEVLDRQGLEKLSKALNSYLKGRWTEESERARNRDDSNGQDTDSSEGTAL